MSDAPKFSEAEYQAAYDTISPRFRVAQGDRLAEAVDTYLLMFRDIDSYRAHRHFATVITDTMLCQLVAEGKISLTDEWKSTPEEVAEMAGDPRTNVDELARRRNPEPGGYV